MLCYFLEFKALCYVQCCSYENCYKCCMHILLFRQIKSLGHLVVLSCLDVVNSWVSVGSSFNYLIPKWMILHQIIKKTTYDTIDGIKITIIKHLDVLCCLYDISFPCGDNIKYKVFSCVQDI